MTLAGQPLRQIDVPVVAQQCGEFAVGAGVQGLHPGPVAFALAHHGAAGPAAPRQQAARDPQPPAARAPRVTATNSGRTIPTDIARYINVSAITIPVVSFTSDTTTGVVPLTIRFNDTSTNYPTSWLWNFGDGSISTAQNPSHVYTEAWRLHGHPDGDQQRWERDGHVNQLRCCPGRNPGYCRADYRTDNLPGNPGRDRFRPSRFL